MQHGDLLQNLLERRLRVPTTASRVTKLSLGRCNTRRAIKKKHGEVRIAKIKMVNTIYPIFKNMMQS